jgi:5-methylcytosine-specific restriction endonuclease McrA
MKIYSLSHLSNETLDHDLTFHAFQGHANTAVVLAHIAEYDRRRRYLSAGYPSMHAYCVHRLRFSEDAAYKRIQAARTAREFPAIFGAIADGRLHLTGLGMLCPYLTTGNAKELLRAAENKTKAEIEMILRQRFPGSELLPMVTARSSQTHCSGELAPAQAGDCGQPSVPAPQHELAPAQVGHDTQPSAPWPEHELAPAQVHGPAPRSRLAPLAQDRDEFYVSMPRSTGDKLRYLQELLSHRVPSGDIPTVLDRAFDLAIQVLEKQIFGATDRPRATQRPLKSGSRHISRAVRHAVWIRDGGQCTFVGNTGHRCTARKFLQFHHLDLFAWGGEATEDNLCLRCRAHNNYAAEQDLSAEFMERKRREARLAAEEKRSQKARKAAEAEHAIEQDLIHGLRRMGFRVDEVRRAAEHCRPMQGASLEDRFRAAIKYVRPKRNGTAMR